MTLLPSSTWKELKKQQRTWKHSKKNGFTFLPKDLYFQNKALNNGLKWVYIDEDHLGKIEDAPCFYIEINRYINKRYMQSGKSSYVKHIPRKTIKVTVSENWWQAKFGMPV